MIERSIWRAGQSYCVCRTSFDRLALDGDTGFIRLAAVIFAFAACTGRPEPGAPTDDAGAGDDAAVDTDLATVDTAGPDAAKPECQWSGAPGTCLASSACSALADHSPEPSTSCASGLSCCIDTPDVADNPPIPAGYKLMMQSMVTPAMTNWAVMILHDPVTYPMFSTPQTEPLVAQLARTLARAGLVAAHQ